MSLAARCPQCHTVFRISGLQLSAAQGWVRCGSCSTVFDATAHLATPQGELVELPTVEVQAPQPNPSVKPALQAMPDIDLELPNLGALATPEPLGSLAGAPTLDAVQKPPPAPLAAAAPQASPPAPAWPGVLVVVGLLISLSALLAYTARGPIVQQWPELRPMVLQWCATLGCQLPAQRRLEALVLQASSLSQDDSSGHHRLRLQWHNSSDAPVIMPAVDLSIVNAQGQVLARRMLDPSELQPALTSVAPGSEAAVSAVLHLRALAAEDIASFRVSTFYP